METQGTAKNQGKDWRKQGLGWVPDYPDTRDYPLDSEEVKKSGNLRRNEVTKSIEDIAENLIEVIESLQNEFPRNQELEKIKTGLKSKVFEKASFYKVKVYTKSLRLGIEQSPQVRQLKYYFQLLSSHPQLPEFFLPKKFFPNEQTYWEWLASEEFDEETEEIVKKFQKQVKIREDGIVGIETYTAISNYIGDTKCSQPDKNTPLVNLLPIPIWIQEDTFQIIFDTLKFWWTNFNQDSKKNVEIALEGLLEPENQKTQSKFPGKFFEMFQKEFYVVEPLVSVIAGRMSPFAIHNDLNSALIKELNKLGKFDKELENSSVKGAILKVADRLKTELEEPEDQDDSDPEKPHNIRKFYEFIQVIVKGYIDEHNLSGDQKLSNSFSPSYLFEIIEQENREVSDSTKGKNIIPVTILNLLVNRNWWEKHQAVKARKPYAILPSLVDLTSWCSPIRDQGSINSCTAFAAAALLEYFARKARDEYTCVSPLFLYKVARNLMNSTGDVGASVRETMKTMVAFGVPPEKYWSYEEDKFDEEPPAFCYSYAQSYKTLKYFCLDSPYLTKEILLFQIQAVLAADFPCIFGFTVYGSIYNEENVSSGCIPYPSKGDQVIGGHTVLAVGYDNYKEIKHSDGKKKSTGAFLIRNSWGTEWGQKGYGWLPYDYVLKGLTADWWSLIKAEWFEAGNFGLGAYAPGLNGKNQSVATTTLSPTPKPTSSPTPSPTPSPTRPKKP
ncbi:MULTISPECIES: C1 family peptidase [unclassified Microcoleus]|uniref:C1 family peptidase n=1 Tax=unclassified Microcoleus TaxID=2642155 RepID=UPI002FD48DFD